MSKAIVRGLRRFGLLASFIAPLFVIAHMAVAQEFNFSSLPVIKPEADVNGVDMTSGGYIVTSPFTFAAPGSGRLNARVGFNSRLLTFDLNIFIDDETFTPNGVGDPNIRQIKVHLGGVDKLFTCQRYGSCTQVGGSDGSMLKNNANGRYEFTDKDGAVYTFFLGSSYYLPSCAEQGTYEPECNAAGYHSWTYVSTIRYPSGEKLTYHSPATVRQNGSNYTTINKITSNLGYRLEFSRTSTSANTYGEGSNWLPFRRWQPLSTTIALYKGIRYSTPIRSIAAYTTTTGLRR